ncbi:MAG: RNA polymerase sigma factor [Candidatus Tectimicrobiota bacterium]
MTLKTTRHAHHQAFNTADLDSTGLQDDLEQQSHEPDCRQPDALAAPGLQSWPDSKDWGPENARREDAPGRASLPQAEDITFWQVWESYRQPLLARRCLRWMGGDRSAADDALSEACLRAWQGWQECAQPLSNVAGWLSRLVQNHCRNLHAAHARHARVVQAVDDIARVSASAGTPRALSPEESLLDDELGAYIRQVIDRLPGRLQAAARLYFLEETPYATLALRLQLTPATLRKRIQQARALLQPQVAAYLGEEAGPASRVHPHSTRKGCDEPARCALDTHDYPV